MKYGDREMGQGQRKPTSQGSAWCLSPVPVRENGFTLLEVLIAASIFASIMLIAVASFTKMNQLNDRAREVRAVTEAGQFVMDDLERAVSNANGSAGIPDPTNANNTINVQQSLAICDASQLLVPSQSSGPGIKLVLAQSTDTTKPAVTTKYFMYQIDPARPPQLVTQTDSGVRGVFGPMAPLADANGVTITNLKFTGVSATVGTTAQPYVTIDMDVTAVPLRAGLGAIGQHFRTSVVSRDYSLSTHGTNTLCSL